jgi:hypothetical protein
MKIGEASDQRTEVDDLPFVTSLPPNSRRDKSCRLQPVISHPHLVLQRGPQAGIVGLLGALWGFAQRSSRLTLAIARSPNQLHLEPRSPLRPKIGPIYGKSPLRRGSLPRCIP